MKHLITVFSLIFFLQFLHSKERDFSLGLSSGFSYSNISSLNYFPGNYDFIIGYNAMLSLEMELQSNILFETNFGFYQNGFNNNNEHLLEMIDYKAEKSYLGYSNIFRQDYLKNSWLVGYRIGEEISLSVNVGIYWAYFMGGKIKSTIYTYMDPEEANQIGQAPIPVGYNEDTRTEDNDKSNYANYDFGLTGSVCGLYKLNDRLELGLVLNYYHGLKNILEASSLLGQVERYNKSISLGLKFMVTI